MKVAKGAPDRREALFGGARAVLVWDLLGGVARPPFVAVLACELEASGSVGRHRQMEHPEIVIGLEGDGEATIDGQGVMGLAPGDVVHLPLGAVLSIRNRSATEPLRYLIIKSRAT